MTPKRPAPHLSAWADQFGALLRDKCRYIQETLSITHFDNVAHEFTDPYDNDDWRLTYRAGHYWITNLSEDPNYDVELDLEALGVNRKDV